MVHPQQVQGKLYNFLSKSELKKTDVVFDTNVTDLVRIHMVICLGTVPTRPDYVKVMTITTSLKEGHEYLPIAPVRKRPYPIQIKLRNNHGWVWARGQQTLLITTLSERSYLKIDEFYEVPEVMDDYGIPLSIPAKHHGGLAELKLHISRRDSERNYEKLCRDAHDQDDLLEAMGNLNLDSKVEKLG
ncbi:uncharacterized protein Bfra_006097 [Botrytis fragariae]|uniref:Uncharacterized protein n=1 Tax=Botrytis fragariae TaxID=1964551 RepID=A0A8H6ASM1_9HELO|nr:uncharacterized protein Bfra_006097 [Botrytis fragariae]KAF5872734.1 hypothetical protein Bfra_006097 [Botrytis fragariae]